MMRDRLSRRGFLHRSSASLAALGLPAWFAGETARGALASPSRLKDPGEGVVMAAIGTGSRGMAVMEEAVRFGAKFVAVCDVDAAHRVDAGKMLAKHGQEKYDEYNDFREILDRKDITAVTVVTPDHWHALIAIEAMKRGKDVYCEKPLSLTIAEGRAMVEAARKYDKVFQTGSQQRSDDRFRLACELVRNGRIGKVKDVETRIGDNPQGGPFPTAEVPKGLDWNMWQGQTPDVEFVEKRAHYEFRWWYEYSGGKVTDWGAHHNDIAQWGLGTDESGPVGVTSECSKPDHAEPNCYNCPPNFKITYTYAKDAAKYCDGTRVTCMSDGENGVKFTGENGDWIFVSREKITASNPKLIDEPLPADAVRLRKSPQHMVNFLESLRSRERPICDVAIGHRSASMCHLGNISLRMGGRTLQWQPAKERFFGDSLADEMLSRPMRAPWKLEV